MPTRYFQTYNSGLDIATDQNGDWHVVFNIEDMWTIEECDPYSDPAKWTSTLIHVGTELVPDTVASDTGIYLDHFGGGPCPGYSPQDGAEYGWPSVDIDAMSAVHITYSRAYCPWPFSAVDYEPELVHTSNTGGLWDVENVVDDWTLTSLWLVDQAISSSGQWYVAYKLPLVNGRAVVYRSAVSQEYTLAWGTDDWSSYFFDLDASGWFHLWYRDINGVMQNKTWQEWRCDQDSDGDGWGDPGYPDNVCADDNCPDTPNPDQADHDADGVGDACDECTDTDGDGFGDPGYPASTCATDNCPNIYNDEQSDDDADDVGDLCDPCTDTDGDGYGNPGYPASYCGLDNCPRRYNPYQGDVDGDGLGNLCDVCYWELWLYLPGPSWVIYWVWGYGFGHEELLTEGIIECPCNGVASESVSAPDWTELIDVDVWVISN